MKQPIIPRSSGSRSQVQPRPVQVRQAPGRAAYSSQVGRPMATPAGAARRPPARRGRLRRRALLTSLLLVPLVLGLRQANGAGGAVLADLLRTVIGPSATAQVEATYLNLADSLTAWRYRITGEQVKPPWTTVSTVAAASAGHSAAAHAAGPVPMPLSPLAVPISPVLPGEGIWTTAGLPGAAHGSLPPVAKTYLRPDPSRPYAVATVLQVDLRVARLHLVAGTSEPGGPVGHPGSGTIPATALQGSQLLAVFNGGFKYADGAYGLMSGGTVYVPPVQGAATVAITRQGTVIMGTWGRDRRLTLANHNLSAWRQNAGLLISRGRIQPSTQNGSAWGLTILDSTYTWRSGIGLTNHGTLLYVAGNSLSAATLATALRAAGAVTAMQLDINPYWVRCFVYGRSPAGALMAWALDPNMPGVGMEYLYGFARDFFYVTRAGA